MSKRKKRPLDSADYVLMEAVRAARKKIYVPEKYRKKYEIKFDKSLEK